jgi:hypothetical protein
VECGLELPLLRLVNTTSTEEAGAGPLQPSHVAGVAAALMLLAAVPRARGRRELRGALQLLDTCLHRSPVQHDSALLAAAAVRTSRREREREVVDLIGSHGRWSNLRERQRLVLVGSLG